jgi:histidine triad (HIT) family protein
MSMSDCIFCKIGKGEIPARVVHEGDTVLAFEDINPVAPVHVLIIPRKHIETTNDLTEADRELIGDMILCAKKIAKERGIAEKGYRTVLNCMAGAGQSVYHIHMHLIGGRVMQWPPG